MNIPTIRPTSCPTSTELGDASKRWSIVHSVNGAKFLGRIVSGEDTGTVLLADCFDYASARELVRGDRGEARVKIVRQIFPVEHFDVEEILVVASSIVPLSKIGPRLLESLRVELVGAWEGREHLRKIGGRIAVVSAVEPVSSAT